MEDKIQEILDYISERSGAARDELLTIEDEEVRAEIITSIVVLDEIYNEIITIKSK